MKLKIRPPARWVATASWLALLAACHSIAVAGPVAPTQPAAPSETLPALADALGATSVRLHRIPLTYALEETLTLRLGDDVVELARQSARGEHFRVMVQDDSGAVRTVDAGPVRTYVGGVRGRSTAKAGVLLGRRGIRAHVVDGDGGGHYYVEPLTGEILALAAGALPPGEGVVHVFYVPRHREHPGAEIPSTYDADGTEIAALGEDGELGVSPNGGPAPRMVGNVCVRVAEMGFDVTYRFYAERNDSDVDTVMDTLEAWLSNTVNLVFTSDCLIQHVMGRVLIRTSPEQDPYHGDTDASAILSEFRSIWNGANSPSRTHDLAFLSLNAEVGVTGLAYVGTVGTGSRYSLATSRFGMGFWRNGGRHEIGHTWSLSHGDGCNVEPTPGNITGDSGIICGGFHERANTFEVGKVLRHRDTRAAGVLPAVVLTANLGPYCALDKFSVVEGDAGSALDVLANDFDANNDNFRISRIRTTEGDENQDTPTAVTTPLGGSVIRSIATGPNERDELLYTAPRGGPGGVDKFHYYATDVGGRSAWGYVNVTFVSAEPGVVVYRDTNRNGPGVKWPPGLHRQGALNDTAVPSNDASSLIVPLHFTVRLYDSDSLFHDEGVKDLGPGEYNLTDLSFDNTGTNMNDRVSALSVSFTGGEGPFVEIFDEMGLAGVPGIYNGEEDGVTDGIYRASRLNWSGVRAGRMSSVRIPPGFTVSLYERDPPAGASVTLTATVTDLASVGFNDRATSMVIARGPAPPTAEVFQDAGFEGRNAWFEEGAFTRADLLSRGIADNSISSLTVPEGWRVTLFENDGFAGASAVLASSVDDLSALGFDDRVSSLTMRFRDGDGDGLDDAWEETFFGGTGATATGDPDGDGLSNLFERFAGGDPGDGSVPLVVAGRTDLIAPGSDWRYLDDGSDQGTDWREPGFDDSGWAAGGAPLGYGEADIATALGFGGDEVNKFVTTYLRRTFFVADPGALDGLTLGFRRDDGIAVYLNGAEVARDNLAAGAAYDTLAEDVIGGAGETDFRTVDIPPSALLPGANTIAVEVHQATIDSSDLGFDLSLSHDGPPFAVGHRPFSAGTARVATNVLVPFGSTWGYLDDGSDPGDAWRNPGFTGVWPAGAAPLGYGDGDIVTTVGFGGDPDQKFITTYFRRTFEIPDHAALGSVSLDLRRDDGAIVYINGLAVARDNLSADATPDTLADSAIGGADETATLTFPVFALVLRDGTNTIAAEVHQSDVDSSDLRFDLSLRHDGDTTPRDHLVLRWVQSRSAAADFVVGVESSKDLLTWRPLAGSAQLVGSSGDTEFFQFIDPEPITSGVERFLRLRIVATAAAAR